MLEWTLARLADRRAVLPPTAPVAALPELTADGIGAEATMRLLLDVIVPSAIPADHPRYLAFIPGVPTVAATIADMVLPAAMIYGGSRIEAGAAADAEDAVLRWLADAAGFPRTAEGTFVSGGSIANLSALVAARGDRYAAPRRQVIVTGASAHSSIAAAARIMGCDLLAAPPADDHGRLTDDTLAAALEGRDAGDVVAVVATAGATNNGAVDDLAGVADVCSDRGIWMHVDGAYGGAALLSPRARHLFAGVEPPTRSSWTRTNGCTRRSTAPPCCTGTARRRVSADQQADYLDSISDDTVGNPSDLAIHLTRRVRGVPLWASVQAYGWRAYTEAVDLCFDIAEYAAGRIAESPHLELALDPALTVVLVRRRGWADAQYAIWCRDALRRGLAMVTPTKHHGETLLRFCFVNPLTTREDVDLVVEDLTA